MVEPAGNQIGLIEKLKHHGKNIRISWSKTGVVSQIDGLITIPLIKNVDESINDFLMEYGTLFGIKIDLSDLKFIGKADGFGTIHFKYQQHHENIPVLHAFTSVHLNKKFKIIKIKSKYYPVISLDTKNILSRGISKDKAIDIVNSLLDAETKGVHHSIAESQNLSIGKYVLSRLGSTNFIKEPC